METVLFLMFAANPLGRRRVVRYRQALAGSTAADRFAQIERRQEKAQLGRQLGAIARAAEACGALPPNGGNAVEFSIQHEQTLEWLLRDIDAAQDHVHLVFYIIADDEVGRSVVAALERAAARGVTCRVVADALGSRQFLRRLAPRLNSRGVDVNVILPAHSDSRLADAAGRAYSAELTDTKVHVHCYRDGFLHAKSMTVDDEIGMVGSANFDVRSFRLDIEANLIFYTATAVKALREIQDQWCSL